MKYKLLVIWADGDMWVNNNTHNTYEEIRDYARDIVDMSNQVAHIGWIEWNLPSDLDPARLHFFTRDCSKREEWRSNSHDR